MFNWFKRKKKGEQEKANSQSDEYTFTWYESGPDNPFNKRILDCRSLTLTVVATTSDRTVAETYNQLRNSDGSQYIDTEPDNKSSIEVNLTYPHNGEELEAIVYKAQSMDEKWDIYIYNNCFYFTRSWVGQLVYKAYAEISADKIQLYKIEYTPDAYTKKNPSLAVSNVHFLIMSHAFGQIYPHRIPQDLQDEKDIAMFSFGLFGNKACYATYEDIIDIKIKE